MTPRLSTIALLCCAVGWRYTPTLEADAFVAPPLVVDNRGGVAARSSRRRHESSSPDERHAAPTARPVGTRNDGEQRQQQQQRLTMASSRLNGADVSEDLTQVNGAAAMPPPVAANTARVSTALSHHEHRRDWSAARRERCAFLSPTGIATAECATWILQERVVCIGGLHRHPHKRMGARTFRSQFWACCCSCLALRNVPHTASTSLPLMFNSFPVVVPPQAWPEPSAGENLPSH